MKTRLQKSAGTSGNILFLCLLVGTLLGATLGTYLIWVRSQTVLVTESQAWNAALADAEAGIEEGLAQVNVDVGHLTQSTNYLNSMLTNGWTGLGGGFYGPRTNSVLDGSYSVIIFPTNPGPTIIATGYTKVPLIAQPIARTVQVTTATMAVFGVAMATKNGITTKGNGLTIDSYDSSDPNYSTSGNYDPTKHQDKGDIASLTGVINVQNANIYGHMKTGPTGTYNLGSGNGQVGDLAWTGPGVKPGWYQNDWYMVIPDIDPPYTSGWAVPYDKNNPTNTYALTNGNYYVSGDFVMSQNETMNVSGNCVLYVTGNFNMKSQNNCQINILSGGSLTVYVGTKDTSNPVSTMLTQVNTPGIALNFSYFGLPSNTSLTWNGNNTYVGAIYAPEADFGVGGGGSLPLDFCGSCVVNTASLNGHFNYHYDQALGPRGPFAGYRVTSWTEL